ncbi:MAG: restriction endonuclease subunit S [Candidatus Promineifilaceae bacterium]
MSLFELPANWEWKPLSDVVFDTERRNPKKTPSVTFRYIDIGSVDNQTGYIVEKAVKSILGKNAPSRARKVVHLGDVIVATTRPYLRNIAQIPQSLDDEICSTGFCVIRPNPQTSISTYIYFACRSKSFIDQILPKQKGANYPAINNSDVFETSIPFPYPDHPERSLAEQRRIVARIETLLGEMQGMLRLQEEISVEVSLLPEAFLTETLDDLRAELPSASLQELVDAGRLKVQGGATPERSKAEYWNGDKPWVSPKDMKHWHITDSQEHITQTAIKESKRVKLIQPNSVLVVVRGMILAHTFPVGVTILEVAINQDIKAFVLDDSIDSEYFGYMLRACSAEILDRVETAAHGTKRLKTDELLGITIPMPEKDIQKSIVKRLDVILNEIDEMKKSSAKDQTMLANLEQAILSQAFRGEL